MKKYAGMRVTEFPAANTVGDKVVYDSVRTYDIVEVTLCAAGDPDRCVDACHCPSVTRPHIAYSGGMWACWTPGNWIDRCRDQTPRKAYQLWKRHTLETLRLVRLTQETVSRRV